MTRKAKLEKALKFDRQFFMPDDTPSVQAMRVNIKLAPLHAALIEAIENLEDIQAWCRDRDVSNSIVYAVCLSRSTDALYKLDKALKEMGVG